MQIVTMRTKFKAFESKFEPFEFSNLNHLNGIQSIQMRILTIWKDLKRLNVNSNHSKGIRSVRIQIWTIWKRFEAFECKF